MQDRFWGKREVVAMWRADWWCWSDRVGGVSEGDFRQEDLEVNAGVVGAGLQVGLQLRF
jgi:hypothetical protein